MARLRRPGSDRLAAEPVSAISRTRRAALVAEFEWDLKIDHKARARAARDAARWQAIKTFIVWSVASLMFMLACQQLYQLNKANEQAFDRPLTLPAMPQLPMLPDIFGRHA